MKMKIIIPVATVLVLAIIAGLVYYLGFYNKKQEQPAQQSQQQQASSTSQVVNPAAVYCTQNGGTTQNVEFPSGTKTYCNFPDGSSCWQWDYYNKNCNKGDLKITVENAGSGPRADTGDTVTVQYVGTLADGTQFDSSLKDGAPFSFTLGKGQVIPGWEYGILGMQVGEKRKLVIAPDLAYGADGISGAIPPNATLTFEVVMTNIQSPNSGQ